MSQITRVPLGLQKALGLETQGDNPSDLAQSIGPGIDLTRYYDLRQRFWWLALRDVTGDGSDNAVVPEGEIWLLNLISVACRPFATTLNDNMSVDVYVRDVQNDATGNGLQFHGLAELGNFSDPIGGGAANYQAKSQRMDMLPMFGGTTIRFAYNQTVVTSGSFNTRVALEYLRIQI